MHERIEVAVLVEHGLATVAPIKDVLAIAGSKTSRGAWHSLILSIEWRTCKKNVRCPVVWIRASRTSASLKVTMPSRRRRGDPLGKVADVSDFSHELD
jgi:hypothetical protein